MTLEALYLDIHEDDETLPDPTEARGVVDKIWPQLSPFGTAMKIARFPSTHLPGVGRRWGIRDSIPLLPEDAPEAGPEFAVNVSFVPTSKRFRGGFSLRAKLFYDQELQTEQHINDRASLLLEVANGWLKLRPGFVAYLNTASINPLREKENAVPFPDNIAWWTWINDVTASAIGRNRLLEAPVYHSYELGGGVAWQLTERFTQKPDPSLLGKLSGLFPNREVVVKTGL